MILSARLRRTPEGMEGRGEERRVVRAHGKKGKGKETDVTQFLVYADYINLLDEQGN
jgi:hypothetical protein